MKLNIIHKNPDLLLNTHTNISPFNSTQDPELLVGDTTNIDWIVDNGECEEIVVLDTLEYIPYNKVFDVISNLVGKLKVGGELILGFHEIEEICRLFYRGHISYNEMNKLLYGEGKVSTYSSIDLVEKLTKQHTIRLKKHVLKSTDCSLVFERYK